MHPRSASESAMLLDTSDEFECNWLCLVRPADTEEQQNCMSIQMGADIYYIALRYCRALLGRYC